MSIEINLDSSKLKSNKSTRIYFDISKLKSSLKI